MKAWLALVLSYVLLMALIIVPRLVGVEPLPLRVVFLLIPIGTALFLYLLVRGVPKKEHTQRKVD
jgi:membrane protein implicated in regulation of membrane protease activity